VPSSTIDVLSRHLEHVTLADLASDLPTLPEVLDAVPDPRHHRGRRHRWLKALPWREAVLNDRTDERGHGRREIRRMKICTTRPACPSPMQPKPSRSNTAAPTSRPARPPLSRSTPSPACHRAASPMPGSPR
jgi:hypothetical protein